MSGPKCKASKLSFDIKKKVNSNNENKLIQVYFGGSKPILSIISCDSIPNTIKVYKCLNTNTHVVIKIENNKMYRLIGPKLINIIINNIDINWQLICSYKDMSNFDIRKLYLEYNIK